MSNAHPPMTDPTSPFAEIFAEAEQSPQYWAQLAKDTFTEEILRELEVQDVSKAELARRLGVSAAQVSRLCRGTNNFEIKTMAAIAQALGCELEVRLRRRVESASKGVTTMVTVQELIPDHGEQIAANCQPVIRRQSTTHHSQHQSLAKFKHEQCAFAA